MPSRWGRSGLGRLRLAGPVPSDREGEQVEDGGEAPLRRARKHPGVTPANETGTALALNCRVGPILLLLNHQALISLKLVFFRFNALSICLKGLACGGARLDMAEACR